jgi:hypothetical protein
MISWFQAFAFKCNVYRYASGALLFEGDALVAAVHDCHADTTCTGCFRRITKRQKKHDTVTCG